MSDETKLPAYLKKDLPRCEAILATLRGIKGTKNKNRYLAPFLKKKSIRAAVNALCAMCMGFDNVPDNVRNCSGLSCPLYDHRPFQRKA